MVNVGIVGGTGYTGVELLRILALHDEVQISVVTSRSDDGLRVDSLYPSLRGSIHICFTQPNVERLADCDVVFFATPNGTAMLMVEQLLVRNVKVIDLSADFRLKNIAEWEHWYGMSHACPDVVEQAVYGLPEIHREVIKKAKLIACAGCYPTAVQLGFLPLIEQGLVDKTQLIADVKSGVSGAGRKAAVNSLMSETGESFKAYGSLGHRHLPEIKQELSQVGAEPVGLTFIPHLVPMIRGIHATLYARLTTEFKDFQCLYEQRYEQELFVDVLPLGTHPDTRNVKGSNRCQMSLVVPQGGDTVVVMSVIDNLVKGAAGQAVQCMNLMLDFEEHKGLQTMALYP